MTYNYSEILQFPSPREVDRFLYKEGKLWNFMKFLGFRPLPRWIGCSTDCLITDHPYSDSFPSPTEVKWVVYRSYGIKYLYPVSRQVSVPSRGD